MKHVAFPVVKTKIPGLDKTFDLATPQGRRLYFDAKAGQEIKKIQNYLSSNRFAGLLIGKKNSGKGTYTKMFMEAVGPDLVTHVSVGDLVREVHANWKKYKADGKEKLLKKNYQGKVSFEQAIETLFNRSTKTLVSTELIMALLKTHLDSLETKNAIFLDGLPRDLDQISHTQKIRGWFGLKDNPDLFVLVDVPEAVMDTRMKGRVVCPVCQVPRHPNLLLTTYLDRDPNTGEIFLLCDNPNCHQARMHIKDGDSLGVEAIRDRLNREEEIMEKILALEKSDNILLSASVPVYLAKETVDDYEIHDIYDYHWDNANKKIKPLGKHWRFKDDLGRDSYTLFPPPVTVYFIKEMVRILKI